ncbi:MAG: sugar phosphate isomerase/epimerase family protein [Candidatus Latescibacteria bacterium]|jgi:xylose isomerase|nr:sugar phosphate isomerase/epimerase family protein [Candidatus Latescibacterota bacterium]
MNKLAIISGFLGGTHNRYMVYQENRTLAEKVAMAAQVEGADGLELCYPADFEDVGELKELLSRYSLGVSAINFRSRRSGKWWRGSFVSEKGNERQEVVDDLKRAMDFSVELGCSRVTTCPLNEGTDNLFEADPVRLWDHAAETFTAACEHNRDVRVCIEYKINDPMARCLFGSAGETASFAAQIGANNLGATMDIGHAFLAGERPSQAAVLLHKTNRLFYVHVNDNDGVWDWDMLPGAYHFWETIEFFYTLRKLGYDNDWYGFDVFPKEIDTVENFSAAMHLTRKLESITDRIDTEEMARLMTERNPAKTIPYLYSLI